MTAWDGCSPSRIRSAKSHEAVRPGGNVIATIDPLGRVTKYGYDSNNRLVSVTDPLGNITTTVYDVAGKPYRHGRPARQSHDQRPRRTEPLVATVDPARRPNNDR